jgi:hypothetical protein
MPFGVRDADRNALPGITGFAYIPSAQHAITGARTTMKSSLRNALIFALAATALHMPAAHAQWRLGIGPEYFDWKEDTTPRQVTEKGPLLSGWAEYTQRRDAGLVGAYRGRLYGGQVEYEGSLLLSPNVPVSGNTRISGMTHEGQLRRRFDVHGMRSVDLVAGAGIDIWLRELSARQKERYVIGFARFGVETEARGQGWMAGIGLKYPFYTHENAHLEDIGFDRNPVFKPGREISPYAHVGYQFADPVSIVLYLDSFKFSQSPSQEATYLPLNQTGSYYQPASTLYRIGLKLMYQFR